MISSKKGQRRLLLKAGAAGLSVARRLIDLVYGKEMATTLREVIAKRAGEEAPQSPALLLNLQLMAFGNVSIRE